MNNLKRYIRFVWQGPLVCFTFVILVFLIIHFQSRSHIERSVTNLPQVDAAIVLGAGITSKGELSTIFKDRVEGGIALYQAGKVKTILVSGDDGQLEYNEVNPAREYLLVRGIPSENIFLDHAGFDTYSSMYRARDIFLITSAIVVTQSFHLPRAVFLARNLDIEAYGFAADQHEYRIQNNLRELLANVKAMMNVIFNRTPKYLGEEIPITGDSRESI